VARAGGRTTPLNGFFTGYKVMDLRPGEFIREIRLPRREPDRRQAFHKVGTRLAQAITKVGLAMNQRFDETWRVAGISLAPFVTRYPGIEAVLNAGDSIQRDDLRQAIDAEVKPIDDLRSTAGYRKKVFRSLLESELEGAGVELR
jgi:xanthine dehydrogenase small subunit